MHLMVFLQKLGIAALLFFLGTSSYNVSGRRPSSAAASLAQVPNPSNNVVIGGNNNPPPPPVFTPPIFKKTDDDAKFIDSILRRNTIFQEFDDDHISQVTLAFETVTYPSGSVICKEGDDARADYVYITRRGTCTVSIDGKQLPDPYGTLPEGTMFGDLAVLYDTSRSATVAATNDDVTLFRLDYESFKYFINLLKPDKNNEDDLKMELRHIDDVIDKVSGVQSRYGGKFIRPFRPNRFWLWTRWSGTVLEQAWKATAFNMLLSCAFIALIKGRVNPTWGVGFIPDQDNPLMSRLLGLSKLWKYMMSITTFILTFFLSQAYDYWKNMVSTGRKIQGRLNDVGLLLAATAERDKNGRFTKRAMTVLEDVAVYSRLFHVFMWANFAKKLSVLTTPRGMSRLFSRGVMSKRQFDTLFSVRSSNGGPHNSCMMWILIRTLRGMKEGGIPDDTSIRDALFDKMQTLTSLYLGIGSALAARIPLAYAHFVQLLVDAFLAMAPFALYPELGIWSIPAVGLLTLFYSGLLDLAKILLDPLDNDDFYRESVNMDLGVLIRESNAGSTRWYLGTETIPF